MLVLLYRGTFNSIVYLFVGSTQECVESDSNQIGMVKTFKVSSISNFYYPISFNSDSQGNTYSFLYEPTNYDFYIQMQNSSGAITQVVYLGDYNYNQTMTTTYLNNDETKLFISNDENNYVTELIYYSFPNQTYFLYIFDSLYKSNSSYLGNSVTRLQGNDLYYLAENLYTNMISELVCEIDTTLNGGGYNTS